MEEHIVFLEDTAGNKAGDFAAIEKIQNGGVYYKDSRDVLCCLDLSEEGEYFMFAERGVLKGARILTSEMAQYEHFGLRWVRQDLAGRHRDYCLCYECGKFLPDTPFNCPVAQKLFQFNVEHQVTTPVWDCAEWEPKAPSYKQSLSEPQFRKLVLNEWVGEDDLPDDALEAHEMLQKRVRGRRL